MRRSKFFDPAYLCHEEYKTRIDKKISFINLSCAFDIESTSFYEGESKRGTMYAFVFGVNGKVVFGRTWQDFLDVLEALQKAYDLSEKKRLCVYVHNFSFEFQWICKLITWLDVFATDERKPLKALCSYGIEFRDSYILSGMSLASTAKNLTKYKIEKLVGDLDYSKIRHSETHLTPKEWHYIENDGLSLMAFIQEEIEKNNNNICDIPMTKTGYVRKYTRNQCYHDGQAGHGARRKVKSRSFEQYSRIMRNLTLTKEEYLLSVECFQGGFTHANCFNVGLMFNNVSSMDLTSAYPSAMVLDRFPMGKGTYVAKPSKEEIKEFLKLYCCIFRVKLWNVQSKFKGDNFISFSKCRNCVNVSQDNGRITSADYLETSITDIDLDIIRAFYDFKKIEIYDLYYYPKGFLPKQFLKAVLGLYSDKTTLKGVEGMEVEFLLKKEMLNSTYGMAVTNLLQESHKYEDNEWIEEEPDIDKEIEKYNNSKSRFLFYIWGIFVTAHVRHIIASAILELGQDYIYADTDSVKFINYEKHKEWFAHYNAVIEAKIGRSSALNGLDVELFKPKNNKGVVKPIGVFDNEGDETTGICYKRFKTLGAKRYFVEYPKAKKLGKIKTRYSLTISGVNKVTAIPVLLKKAKKEGKDIFDYFNIGQEFDQEAAGKNTHSYCDYSIEGDLTDYKGVTAHYKELSFMHLEATTYKLTTSEEFYEQLYLDQKERLVRREKIKL